MGLAVVSLTEHGDGPVTVYTAVDPESDGVGWTLEGADADDFDDFTILDGRLEFTAPPDFEAAADENRDNVYHVTLSTM